MVSDEPKVPKVVRYPDSECLARGIADEAKAGFRLHSWNVTCEPRSTDMDGDVPHRIGGTWFYALFIPVPEAPGTKPTAPISCR